MGTDPAPRREATRRDECPTLPALRDEVTEQLERKSEALTSLAKDWRMVFDPETSDFQFADGYAQTVTFGLLMARARGIPLGGGFDQVAKELGKTNTLIGAPSFFDR